MRFVMVRVFFLGFVSLIFAPVIPSHAVTKVVAAGQMLLMRDDKETQYGAVRMERIEPKQNRIVYRWFLPPEKAYDLTAANVESGTVEIRQVRGRAVVAFGPFVLEWHGSAEQKGIFSANGTLGTQPLYIASSGIHDPSKIRDMREGYHYEVATPRETPTPLGLTEAFADLPKARLGIGVEEVFIKDENGLELPSLQINRIDTQSKAFEAGLREHQELVAFNGVEIFSAADFQERLKEVKPGDKVKLTVMQNGEMKDYQFEADTRVPTLSTQPQPTPDPNLPPEERARQAKDQEVLRLMQESVEALRARYFD